MLAEHIHDVPQPSHTEQEERSNNKIGENKRTFSFWVTGSGSAPCAGSFIRCYLTCKGDMRLWGEFQGPDTRAADSIR